MSHQPNEKSLEAERLVLALRASNEGIWDWLTDQTGIYYSRRILEFLECASSNSPNLFLAPHSHVHPEDRPAFQRSLSQALDLNGPETLAIDARIQTGGNTWRWLRIRGTVVRDRGGNAIRIAGSMIDISQRKLAEAQVEEERHLLRTLIDHVPLQIYFKDLESRILMANKGMADWHKFASSDDFIGKHDRDLFSKQHSGKAAEDEQRIIKTGEPMTGQIERETWREGGETFVLTSKFPWRDKSGKIKGTFGVSSDVTSLVLAQRQATELAAELQTKNSSYEEELLLAREIQQALSTTRIPSAKHPDGSSLTFGSRYLPISGLAGDFFEVIPLPGDRYGIFISDVMGHGVRAALVVAMLRGLLVTQNTQTHDAAAFLHGLNQGLCSILKRANVTMFATAFYGIIDLRENTLTYSCAGHPGPVVSGSAGTSQICTNRREKGPALGLFDTAEYASSTLDIALINHILLFTDGVLEAENQLGEPFLENRLLEIIETDKETALDNWLDHVLNSVLAFASGNHFDDDVCLLGIQINHK